ncbi:MAG TPA: thioredoxin family protein [Candidatus Sulfotelmatobacter sp.]|nr:thioredoxin family protein [Candidatus Sulfotelmatobacter sp.]
MLNIVVFGPGCSRCVETERMVRRVVEQMGIPVEVQKVNDPQGMAKAGVLLTPAVTVNGVLKVSGRIPKEDEIRGWFALSSATADR